MNKKKSIFLTMSGKKVSQKKNFNTQIVKIKQYQLLIMIRKIFKKF